MLQNKDRIWLIDLPQICLFVFLFLQIIAMLLYSGGTLFNPDTLHYSFIRNFLSDLGRSEGFSGNNNFLSSQFPTIPNNIKDAIYFLMQALDFHLFNA